MLGLRGPGSRAVRARSPPCLGTRRHARDRGRRGVHAPIGPTSGRRPGRRPDSGQVSTLPGVSQLPVALLGDSLSIFHVDRGDSMTRTIRIQFIAVVLLTLLAIFIVAPIPGKSALPILSGVGIKPGMDLAGGAELRYTMLFEPGFNGDRGSISRLTADVLRRRLESRLLQEPRIVAH